MPVKDGSKGDSEASDRLAEAYGSQIEELMRREAERRVSESVDPIENERLLGLSLSSLVESDSPDVVPALMSRLGPVSPEPTRLEKN